MSDLGRIDNKHGDEHCEHCCVHPGLVFMFIHSDRSVDHEPGAPGECPGCAEYYAPCPFCVRGRQLEFPSEGKGSWGNVGFWKGVRPHPSSVPKTCDCNAKATAPPEEARALLKEMIDRLSASTRMPIEREVQASREAEERAAVAARREAAEAELSAAMGAQSAATLLDDDSSEAVTLL